MRWRLFATLWLLPLCHGFARAQPPTAAASSTAPASPDPAAARIDHEAGLAKLQAGDVAAAIDHLRTAASKNPNDAVIAADLGNALLRFGARMEAEAQYQRAIALEPRRWQSYVNLAELAAQSPERWQRHAEIEALLDKGLQLVRDDPRGRQSLALAIAAFQQSVGRVAPAKRRIEAVLGEELLPSTRMRAQALLAALSEDERALTLGDWPEPHLTPALANDLEQGGKRLHAGRPADALADADRVLEKAPASTEARFVRARALAALGRPDEAIHELKRLVQLRPSFAQGWRLLGTLLALRGGALEVERADEALRRALALEPSWDDLRELRRQLARRRAELSKTPARVPAPAPTAHALKLYEEAQRWLAVETPELAKIALAEALAESPGFIDAAAMHFAVTAEPPAASATALWNDAEGLAHLASELLRIRPEADTVALVRPWLDRAIALGSAEARFVRGLARAESEDAEGALADLAAYAASDVDPPRLAEARALRRKLAPGKSDEGANRSLARHLLLADRPREAARVLGGTCKKGLSAETLVELGRIAEYEERTLDAVACHRLALAALRDTPARPGKFAPSGQDALERLGRIAARMPAVKARNLTPELATGQAAGLPIANWALARLAHEDGRTDEAIQLGDRFVAAAAPEDPVRGEAEHLLSAWKRSAADSQRMQSLGVRFAAAALGLLALVIGGLLSWRRLRSHTVTGALARAPDLFPDVAAAVAEIRHDVLKHRASALGLVDKSPNARSEAARALREPSPTSTLVATIYDRLRRAAAAAGLNLRPLDREPVFGPLVRTLGRAERQIERTGNQAELGQLDRKLREEHGPALGALLKLCPRTRLDPAQVAGWLEALQESTDGSSDEPKGGKRPDGQPVIRPGLHLPALDLEVPLPREALHAIVANLVRNAIGAAAGSPNPEVLLRAEQTRDATGRRLVTFLVADSASTAVSLDDIERRDGQRGLGIVRDLVRRWGGHMVVRTESAPYVKAIGAAFPSPANPGSGT